jgi:hypothetical protein
MIRVHADRASAAFTAEIWTQDSPGVPGTAEAGDHFGAALATVGFAVGIPGEDLGSIVDAGAVQTFIDDWSGAPNAEPVLRPASLVTQADPEVAGEAEAGDRFGAALISGILDCPESISMAIGAPGEDVGAVTDAGSVTFVWLSTDVGDEQYACHSAVLRKGRGLPGTPGSGDALGASLGTLQGAGFEETSVDAVLIGVPGEDAGTAPAQRNTGKAILWNGLPKYAEAFGPLGGDLPGLGYGTVFAARAKG